MLSGGLHPHYAETIATLARAAGVEIVRRPLAVDDEAGVVADLDKDVACVVVQTPNVFGTATDVSKIAEAAHAAGALLIVVVTEGDQLAIRLTPKFGWSGKSRPDGRITSIHGAPARLRA